MKHDDYGITRTLAEQEEEEFVFTVPEDGEDYEELVYPVLTEEEAAKILAQL